MVQLPSAANRSKAPPPPPPVKLEIEDPLEDAHAPLDKRCRTSPHLPQWGACGDVMPHNLLEEPSPLGLRLRKSPSLLDLIQMRLSQADSASITDNAEVGKKDAKHSAVSSVDKMKASNFPASLLRIGAWERVSRYQGDLVAKCYFAKHKLVWEVLEGGLKSKIEIQWSDITALKATLPEDAPGSLDIVLARQPLFFRETNPQPRKHTLWQATSDFTGGQASIYRRHFLQCAQGLLNKHFEKLIQCDPRLNSLSQQPEIILESQYFELRYPPFEDQDESKCHSFDNMKDSCAHTTSGSRDLGSPSIAPSVSTTSETTIGRTLDHMFHETPSPNSVMDAQVIEENTSKGTEQCTSSRCWEQVKVPVLQGSMSMSDLVNHIGNCISDQIPGNPFLSADGSRNNDMLEDLAQYLLGDSQIASASDEQSLMSRVNSLCCLLQKDAATFQNLNIVSGEPTAGNDGSDDCALLPAVPSLERKPFSDLSASERQSLFDLSVADEASSAPIYRQPPPRISRKESFGELLTNLPRIASLPQVLFKIAEDPGNQKCV